MGETTALSAMAVRRLRYEPPTSTMEVFKAPITTKLDSGPEPSAGRATRGRPVAIVPRKAQANAIRLRLDRDQRGQDRRRLRAIL